MKIDPSGHDVCRVKRLEVEHNNTPAAERFQKQAFKYSIVSYEFASILMATNFLTLYKYKLGHFSKQANDGVLSVTIT